MKFTLICLENMQKEMDLIFFYSLFFFYSIDLNMPPSAVLRKGSKYLRLECYC